MATIAQLQDAVADLKTQNQANLNRIRQLRIQVASAQAASAIPDSVLADISSVAVDLRDGPDVPLVTSPS